VYILDTINGDLVKAEIVRMDVPPLKKDGWNFNWRQIKKEDPCQTFILQTVDTPHVIQGAIKLKVEYKMLVMDAVEVAPHNFGRNKRYDYVAGCLIAFACRESFKIEGPYKGFLSFVSKTALMRWYIDKYGAEVALGQRMYIDFEAGKILIEKYLEH